MELDTTTSQKQMEILEKAEKLFATKGFKASSVREIAVQAQVNVAMISYYFGSKDKLFEKLFQVRMQDGQHYVKIILANQSLNEWEKMERILEAYSNRIKENQNFYQIMLAVQARATNKKVLEAIKGFRIFYLQMFEDLIDSGIRNKLFTKKPDDIVLQSIISGTLFYGMQGKQMYKSIKKNMQPMGEYDDQYFHKLCLQLKSVLKFLIGYEN